MNRNKISIITITFEPNINDLNNNLICVLNQTYQNIEHIIQDGSISFKVKKKVLNFKSRNKNNKIKYFHEKDLGIYDALNKAILKCTGDIIGILHSDDIFYDNEILAEINNNFLGNEDILYGDLIYINKNYKIIRKWKSTPFHISKLKFGWMPPHPTMFVNSKIFKNFGLYRADYKVAGDYEFILRILMNKCVVTKYIPKIITKMKLGGNSNKSLKNILLKSYEDFKALKQNKIGGFFTLLCKNIRKLNQFF